MKELRDLKDLTIQVPIKTLIISITGSLVCFWAIVFATGKVLNPRHQTLNPKSLTLIPES